MLKCGVHAAAGVIVAAMAAYNIAACCYRRDLHLRINAVVYTLAIGYELRQVLHHLDSHALATAVSEPQPIDKCA